jgi:DNA-binding transcriptional ArsR family regulator
VPDEEGLDEILRALAHPVRRRLLDACRERPRPAMELAAAVGEPAATVSEHLKVLRKTRLVVLRASGRFRLYQADPEVVEQARRALRRLASGP